MRPASAKSPRRAVPDLTDPDAPSALRELVERQEEVVSRRQLSALGIRSDAGGEQVQLRRWQRILPGVYLTNTGRVTFRQRCWAASLYAGPRALLSGEAAAYLDGTLERQPEGVVVIVPHGTRVATRASWLTVRQVRTELGPPQTRPPRTARWFTAILRTQSATSADDVVAILTETARAAGTAEPLRREIVRWRRLRWRDVIEAVLARDEEGHESVLEWKFTHLVLRAHQLPEPSRQKWESAGGVQIRVDGVEETWGVRFELDGRIHEGKTADDIWRDNLATVTQSRPTLRFRWRHVLGQACESARLIEVGYQRQGWPGAGRPCGPGCPCGR